MRFAILAVFILVLPASAQDSVSLKWKLKEGEKFFAKNVTEMDMNVGVMGMNIDMKVNINAVQRYKILSAKQDSTTVELTILAMDMTAEGPANIPGLGAIGERSKGATLTAVLDDNMEVTKLEGYDKFIDKMAGDDAAARMQLKQQFSEATMKQMFNETFNVGSKSPVKVGDTWPKTEKIEVGGMNATVKTKNKLESYNSGIATVGYTGDLSFKAGAAFPGLPEGVKVDQFDMKADKYIGTIKFDTTIGRLKESKQEANMNGTASIAFGGQKIEMTMKIKLKQTSVIDDKNPIRD